MIKIPLVAAFVVFLDQLSKYWILQNIFPGEMLEVIPGFFNLTLAFNKGAAFGFMSGLPEGTRQIVMTLTACLAFGALAYFFFVEFLHDSVAHTALAAILGGAFGNIIDRVRLGMVVDFLDVYYGSYHWPAFNVADSSICLGVAILLLRKPRRAVSAGDIAS